MEQERRKFLQSCMAVTVAAAFSVESHRVFSPAYVQPFELDEITIAGLQNGMKSGKFTARSVTAKYLVRIEQIDKHGPVLRSVIETNPDALAIAESLDNERKQKGPRGPLHGIPILLKDNIDTSDRMSTTAGSLALMGAKPAKDAAIVRKLRTAGAVILGKTNPSEWANIRSSHSTSGWSARGGLTKNPYALDRNPCGSSSGSGVAVSANLCAAAIGTETDGSIVFPSSMNGIVGIKPTVGLASRSGIIPISHTQDTPGPMCRSVQDAAIVLSALAGADPEDAATEANSGKVFRDYTQFLDPNGLRGARIGVVRRYFGFNEAVDALMENALEMMKKQGAVLVDPANIETASVLNDVESSVLLYEFKADLNAYLSQLGPGAPVHSLHEIIEFNDSHREKEMTYFGQDLFLKAQEKGPLTEKEYVDALKLNLNLSRKQGVDATVEKFQLDSLVAPTAGPAFVTDLLNGDRVAGGSSTAAAMAGYPSISVPAGFINGLPVGISFFGRAWSEPVLLKLAYAFERASNARKRPRFLPAIDLLGI
jgi:amidase